MSKPDRVTWRGSELSKLVEPDDGALVVRCLTGDRDAFADLVHRHQTSVYRVCYRILGNHEDAEDAAQEALVRAYTKLESFEGRSSFKTWMLRLAVNVSLNERSKRKGPPPGEIHYSPLPTPEDELIRSENVDHLHKTLQLLPPNHRAAVVLRDLEELTYLEVAEALGVPEGTAKGWAHRGRMKLKELMS